MSNEHPSVPVRVEDSYLVACVTLLIVDRIPFDLRPADGDAWCLCIPPRAVEKMGLALQIFRRAGTR